MASPPPPPQLDIPPPTPERLGRDIRSAPVTSTHASSQVAAPVSPSWDVIFEILSWLPAKSLGRCRCVSKEWRALISDPAFAAAHRSRAEPLLVAMSGFISDRTLLLFDTVGTVVRVVDLGGAQRFPSREERWTLRGSLGDLACISAGYDQSYTLVVDLATGKTLLACFKPAEDAAAGVWSMNYLCFGFGRAVQSGSLKVFRLGRPQFADTQICEVLTLGDGAKWRQTKSPPIMLCTMYSNASGVAVNGALHFLSKDKGDVLSFDLDNEKWKVIHGPRGAKEVISELNGALCMVQRLQHLVNVWLLGDYDKNIWMKAYTIPVAGFVVPLRVLRFGGELLFYYYDYRANPVLQVYDPRSGKCTNVKTPTNLMGKIGLCGSNLDPRFCGQS